MFCPECGMDYEGGASHCLDCEVPLVAQPEEAGGPEFIPLIEVTKATACALVIARLEEEGIPWFVQSEPPLGFPSEPGNPVAMIYVAEDRLEQARQALEMASPIGVGERD